MTNLQLVRSNQFMQAATVHVILQLYIRFLIKPMQPILGPSEFIVFSHYFKINLNAFKHICRTGKSQYKRLNISCHVTTSISKTVRRKTSDPSLQALPWPPYLPFHAEILCSACFCSAGSLEYKYSITCSYSALFIQATTWRVFPIVLFFIVRS